MKYVVIRDDDTCAHTKSDMLETLYRPLLDAGKSISLSVVPAIGGGQPIGSLNGQFWQKYRLLYSPCLPPDRRADQRITPLSADCEIVRYLSERAGYEITQHGYNHLAIDGVREGMLTDARLITEKVEVSRAIMEECFGQPCDFFVAPWDYISYETLKILKRSFKGISLYRVGQRHVSWPRKLQAAGRRFIGDSVRTPYFKDGKFLLLEYPGPFLSMFQDYPTMKDKVTDYLAAHDILILVTHYWEFFWDWDKPNREFLSAWHDIVNYLLDRPDVEIISFSMLYSHLYSAS